VIHGRKRLHATAHRGNDDRWLLTYADMITLLTVLFVVLYAVSITDLRKFSALADSFSAAFNIDLFTAPKGAHGTTAEPPGVPGAGLLGSGSGVLGNDLRSIEATVRDYAIRDGLGAALTVDRVPEGIAIHVGGGLLFASGRAQLDDVATGVIGEIAAVVKPLPNAIRVEGHTDDIAPDPRFFADNWELSTERAVSVVHALASSGVDPSRLAAAGFAANHPLAPNTDEASRARNRRVDIVLLYTDQHDVQPIVSPGLPFDPEVLP
jgi:chemotaxis protein MotB